MWWILYILTLPAIFVLYHFGKGVAIGLKHGLPVVFRIVGTTENSNKKNENDDDKSDDQSKSLNFRIIK